MVPARPILAPGRAEYVVRSTSLVSILIVDLFESIVGYHALCTSKHIAQDVFMINPISCVDSSLQQYREVHEVIEIFKLTSATSVTSGTRFKERNHFYPPWLDWEPQ